jgi:hypothetical protein
MLQELAEGWFLLFHRQATRLTGYDAPYRTDLAVIYRENSIYQLAFNT